MFQLREKSRYGRFSATGKIIGKYLRRFKQEDGMNVIFLDIDGVLNDRAYLDQGKDTPLIRPDCLERLKRIAVAGSAELVLVSS